MTQVWLAFITGAVVTFCVFIIPIALVKAGNSTKDLEWLQAHADELRIMAKATRSLFQEQDRVIHSLQAQVMDLLEQLKALGVLPAHERAHGKTRDCGS